MRSVNYRMFIFGGSQQQKCYQITQSKTSNFIWSGTISLSCCSTHKLCHLCASPLRNTAETYVQEKKTTDSCNNMLSGTSIIEWHIKKQMYERKYIVCLVSFLIMCFCLRVKRCDCGGGSCFVWGRKWQLGNSGYAMVSKERHNRNAGTATTLPTQHTTTYLHLPS